MTNTYCSWIDDNGMCGTPAEVRYNLALCGLHRNNQVVRDQIRTAAHTVKALDCDPADTVYFIETPTGTIKIGTCRRGRLGERMKELHRNFGGPVRLLATDHGGLAVEARYHTEFAEHRITEAQGEQFFPAEELLSAVGDLGISPWDRAALDVYAAYRPTGTAQAKPEWAVAA